MDDAKKSRTTAARKVTRKYNELLTAIKGEIHANEIQEKIDSLKQCMDDLGKEHDNVMQHIAETEIDAIAEEEKWYTAYDAKTNEAVKQARKYIDDEDTTKLQPVKHVKLKKLELPKFNGDPKDYYKWKGIYDRFTNECDEETKYDYLLSSTTGEARRYVENKASFTEAIERLDEKYGNIHTIMGILIEEVKSLHVVRKGDFRAFEQFSLKVDEFYDRLNLMGKASDVENSYVLKELEGKLNAEDIQKWLESTGDLVDDRRVEDLKKWLEHQTRLRRISYSNHGVNRNPPFQKREPINRSSGSTSVGTCLSCSASDHFLGECPEFLQLDLDARWDRVKYFRCCFICLRFGHKRDACPDSPCNICSRPHHQSLHRFVVQNRQEATASPVSRDSGKSVTISRSFLPIVRVPIIANERNRQCTVALDSLSELNIISARCVQQLGLVGDPFLLEIEGAGGVKTVTKTKLVKVTIMDTSWNNHEIECVVLSKACGRAIRLDERIMDKDEVRKLKDMNIYTNGGDVDILIGMTNPALHKQFSLVPFTDHLYIMETRFGRCLVGSNKKKGTYQSGQYSVNSISVVHQDPDELKWRNYLEAEMAGITPTTVEKSYEEETFDKRIKISKIEGEENRFQVSLAWKFDPETFENNREQAVDSDKRLLKQLQKNPDVQELFDKQFAEMVEMNILREVDETVPKRYLPLLAVSDLDRESTKVRICLDAKRKFNGVSFNDFLLNGKLEMSDIFQVFTVFRSGDIAIQGDIKKMFWQILLSEYDQQFHGVIYKGKTHVFTRVCFGDKPSPMIADSCMRLIAEEEKDQFPEGSDVICKKRFVDDLLDSSISNTKMIQKRDETSKLLGQYGFEIKEWLSNRNDVGRVKENGKVLGMLWNGLEDVLSIKIKEAKDITKVFTKRIVLKNIAGVWDPLGLLCGLLIVGKLIFQSVVRMKLNWDEQIKDEELAGKWQEWLEELSKCDGFCMPRSILPSKGAIEDMNFEIIGCGDGSSVAYGGAVYIRWYDKNEENIELKFIGGKGKLNPIKGTTVPRSELCGTLLAAQLVHSAEESFQKTEINDKFEEKIILSDSTTVISWVKSASIKYKPFVKNKIMKCQELHPVHIWDYIPGKQNEAADLISKGCKYKDLDRIIKGPEMLYLPRKEWTKLPELDKEEEVEAEKCASLQVNATTLDDSCIDEKHYHSWKKLVRVTAFVKKFTKQRVRPKDSEEPNIKPVLSKEELREAENYLIRRAQASMKLDDRQYQQFSPFKDEDGIIRIYGRLKNMQVFDRDRKHPILLPKNAHISLLITSQIHADLLHPGHPRVMAEVRKRFWIVGLRCLAKSIGKKCVTCRKWRGLAMEQRMSNLPSLRVNASYPFENTAIDYFGPFDMKYGYKGRTKAYGVVFTCLTTRAVHVELATDLSTDTFLLALRRFMSHYGTPKEIRSDNGKNFVGAANEIRRMIKSWTSNTEDRAKLREECDSNSIKWTFSTPTASHHNGAVESMVKSVKLSLKKLLKDQVYKEEEYRTIFAQVTSMVNSRPLWPASDDDVYQPPITCNDLLRPRGLPQDPAALNIATNPRKRYEHIQKVVNDWWKIWLQNFTPNLQSRSKWFKERTDLAVGDVVLLIDPNIPRGQWSLGLVDNVYRGDDNRVQSVRVKTSSGYYDRPISKLCLLLSKEEQTDTK